MADRKYMDIGEFRSLGLLQEVNRRVLHPLGVALEATCVPEDDGWDPEGRRVQEMAAALAAAGLDASKAKDVMDALYPPGSQHLSGVWDVRHDPGGVIFGGDVKAYADSVDRLWREREPGRIADVGFMVEPVEDDEGGS